MLAPSGLMRHLNILHVFVVICGLCLATDCQATLRTWSGLGADSYWTTSGNWDILPAVNGDSLNFAGSSGQNNTNNFPAITNSAITFVTGGWTLNGSNVCLGGNI